MFKEKYFRRQNSKLKYAYSIISVLFQTIKSTQDSRFFWTLLEYGFSVVYIWYWTKYCYYWCICFIDVYKDWRGSEIRVASIILVYRKVAIMIANMNQVFAHLFCIEMPWDSLPPWHRWGNWSGARFSSWSHSQSTAELGLKQLFASRVTLKKAPEQTYLLDQPEPQCKPLLNIKTTGLEFLPITWTAYYVPIAKVQLPFFFM